MMVSEEWSTLSPATMRHLLDLALGCPALVDRSAREAVFRHLPPFLRHRSDRAANDHLDVLNLLHACGAFPAGFSALLDAIQMVDGDSLPLETFRVALSDEGLLDPSHAYCAAPTRSIRPSRTQQNRARMIEKVRQFWIVGLLHESLHDAAMLELGLERQPQAVQRPWDMVVQRPDEVLAVDPTTRIIDLFDEAGGTLLILGTPGAGKTTLLLDLARDLLDRAAADAMHALPVVFNLAAWASAQRSLAEWLVTELRDRYDVPPKQAQQWVDDEIVLPLLDGLDEVRGDVRNSCVRAINMFREEHPAVPLVVCSRIADYEALMTKLRLHDAVLIQPLTSEQVDAYLALAGPQLARVRLALMHDPALRELTESPLLLSIMILAYAGYADLGAGTVEERRRHLFAAYVDRMFQRRPPSQHWSEEQTRHWLTWLAHRLVVTNITIFFLEQLTPDVVSVKVQHWCQERIRLVSGLVSGVMSGLVSGVVSGVVSALVFGPVFGLISALGIGLVLGVVIGLVIRLLTELLYGETLSKRTHGFWNDALRSRLVATGETLSKRTHWSWNDALRGGLIAGLVGAGIIGMVTRVLLALLGTLVDRLLDRPVDSMVDNLVDTLIVGVGYGVIFGLMYGLISGLRSDVVPTTTRPNEGLQRTVRTMLVFGLVGGTIIGLVSGLLLGVDDGITDRVNSGLLFGLLFGHVFALLTGGYTILLHLLTRRYLEKSNAIPRDYVPFLNSCVDRLFLRRVGGGYIFVHRLLMEHFASLEPMPADDVEHRKH